MPASRSTPVRIVVVAEAEADRRMVCGLIDRKVAHHAPQWWHDQDDVAAQLNASREWIGLEARTEFTRWNRLKHLTLQTEQGKAPGVRTLGFNRLGVRHHDRESMRTALIHFMLMQPPPDALVISRDLDGQHPEERRASLEAGAQEAVGKGVRLVLATQAPMREAWLLNGFVVRTEAEREAHQRECASIRFDPCCEAERLTVADESAIRSAKRALRALTNGDSEREEACWAETDWLLLRERGLNTGLKMFLDAVKEHLVRLVTGEPPRQT